MKERFVMTTFVAGQLADASITTLGLASKFSENGIWIKRLLESGGMEHALIAKLAVTTVLLGLYAFSNESHSKYFSPVDKGLRAANLITWGVVALNTLRVAGYL